MEQRNLIMAIVLSVSILLGFQLFVEAPRLEKERVIKETQKAQQMQQSTSASERASPPPAPVPGASGIAPTTGTNTPIASRPSSEPGIDRTTVLNSLPGKDHHDRMIGSIRLKGALIDDLTHFSYRQTIKKDSPNILLLSPLGTDNPYYAQFGWVSQTAGITVPDADTVWTADRETLSVGSPVTLSWTNPQGIVFSQTVSLDKNFMFSIRQAVKNNSRKVCNAEPIRPYFVDGHTRDIRLLDSARGHDGSYQRNSARGELQLNPR